VLLCFCCRRLRTRFIEATHNPVWNERHEVYLADEADTIKLSVKVGRGSAGHARMCAQGAQTLACMQADSPEQLATSR
jgi:hypothetical protein